MKIDQNADTKNLESPLRNTVEKTVAVLRDKKLTVGFAESCTGGLLSSLFTELPGVSEVFRGAVVCYDNQVKIDLLEVSAEALESEGAVSAEIARQMANGAHQALDVEVSIAITGIAGPGGGSPLKPVGTVFIALAGVDCEPQIFEHHFDGNRKEIQLQSCVEAVKHLNEFINKSESSK